MKATDRGWKIREISSTFTCGRGSLAAGRSPRTIRASTAQTLPWGSIKRGLISISVISVAVRPRRDSPVMVAMSPRRSADASPRKGPRRFRDRNSSSMASAWTSLTGATRKTTSPRASVKMPPRPNMTTGPNWGSQNRPATNSRRPVIMGWTRKPSRSAPALAMIFSAAVRASSRSRRFRCTRPLSVLWVSRVPSPLSTTG